MGYTKENQRTLNLPIKFYPGGLIRLRKRVVILIDENDVLKNVR